MSLRDGIMPEVPEKFLTLAELAAGKTDMCYYSTRTVWWACDFRDLRRGPVPLDVFGAPLFQSDETAQFFDPEFARKQPTYGELPVTTWTMAHHKNMVLLLRKFPDRFRGELLKPTVCTFEGFGALIVNLVRENLIPNMEAV